ncbi:VWA domain-containing protein [Murinocardiopsis flavida]|nr:VWA domain-containing protein [Murinocardiopsis flavida]
MTRYRYGPYRAGPDPLAPPADTRAALDALGRSVIDGDRPRDALRRLLHRGTDGLPGLDDLRERARTRTAELRSLGRLDGTLERVRALLDRAVSQERAALAAVGGDDAALREAELGALPADTAAAVRRLADYAWRSDAARSSYAALRDLLRREVLDSRFRGAKDALAGTDPAEMARVASMIAALNAMLDADARGAHTPDDFDRFMAEFGDLFPELPELPDLPDSADSPGSADAPELPGSADSPSAAATPGSLGVPGSPTTPGRPRDLDELVDVLARRSAAAQRLLDSLTPDRRDTLLSLSAQAMAEAGLTRDVQRLGDALRARRPDLAWSGAEDMAGSAPLGMGDATTALADLADLAEVERALAQHYPGADLADVDEDAVRRALGRRAVDDLARLRSVERDLRDQGLLGGSRGRPRLTPKALRRLGATALREVLGDVRPVAAQRAGAHSGSDPGPSGEPTGSTRPWSFGDERPIDAVRTVRNAVARSAPGAPLRLGPRDFEVAEAEQRRAAAVSLLVDVSYSMRQGGLAGAAKRTAMALHALVETRYPQDAVQVVAFNDHAREVPPKDLVDLAFEPVQGTNLHHALLIAGRHVDRHPGFTPVVLVVTDGEPTAHLERDGAASFAWPPVPRTAELTFAEVDRMTRRGAVITVFLLDEAPGPAGFAASLARRNGGRVVHAAPERLGAAVVLDYLARRQHP